MPNKNGPQDQYEESFKQAAVEFLSTQGGTLETAAAELGVEAGDLRAWKRKLGTGGRSSKSLGAMAQLRAENEALRNQIISLQVQWDVLKTTLGVLSTTVCSREAA